MLTRFVLPKSRRHSIFTPTTILLPTPTTPTTTTVRHAHHQRFRPKAAKKRTSARPLAAWKLREKQLKSELALLESQVNELHKRNTAKEATKDLPELDEATLDQIYSGLKEADPIPESELKLLEAHKQKTRDRYARVVQNARKLLPISAEEGDPLPPLSFTQRMQQRLVVLSTRLETMQKQALAEGAPSSSATAPDLALWKDKANELNQSLEALAAEPQPAEAEEETDDLEAGGIDDASFRDFETLNLQSSEASSVAARSAAGSQPNLEALAPAEGAVSAQDGLLGRLVGLLDAAEASSADRSAIFSVIDKKDWAAFGTSCAQQGDPELFTRAFNIIETAADEGLVSTASLQIFYDSVADAVAQYGDSATCEIIVQRIISSGLAPTSLTHHALVKAYLRAPDDRIAQALSLINHLEQTPTPVAESTYALTLSHLIDSPSREIRDEVWGLWYRMRLNAYPVPDAVSWSKMLRACAAGTSPVRDSGLELLEQHRKSKKGPSLRELRRQDMSSSERETALDLFREMTVVHGIRPTPACYNNLILACCRSRDEGAYLDGFRLLSEMIGLAKEHVSSGYEPDRATFDALMEGCRRGKDVLRARWILAEMIRSSAPLWSSPASVQALSWDERATLEAKMPASETLEKLFHTYSAWVPTGVAVAAKRGQDTTPTDGKDNVEATSEASESTPDSRRVSSPSFSSQTLSQIDLDEAASEFSSRPPMTSAEVIREVRGLLARIVSDRVSPGTLPIGPMSSVEMSPRLMNAYLAVLISHAPRKQLAAFVSSTVRPDETQQPPQLSLYQKLDLAPDGHTWKQVLYACFASVPSDATRSLAEWSWTQWRILESEATAQGAVSKGQGTDKVTREKVWAERIKYLTKAGDVDAALSTLREFIALYPPMPQPARLPKAKRKLPFFDFNAVLDTIQRAQYASGKGRSLLEATVTPNTAIDGTASPSIEAGLPTTESTEAVVATSTVAPTTDAAGSATIASSPSPASLPVSTSPSPSPSTSTSALATSSPSTSPPRWSSSHRDRPPSLSFFDLNLLHQRLLELDRQKDIQYVGWACRIWHSTQSVGWRKKHVDTALAKGVVKVKKSGKAKAKGEEDGVRDARKNGTTEQQVKVQSDDVGGAGEGGVEEGKEGLEDEDDDDYGCDVEQEEGGEEEEKDGEEEGEEEEALLQSSLVGDEPRVRTRVNVERASASACVRDIGLPT